MSLLVSVYSGKWHGESSEKTHRVTRVDKRPGNNTHHRLTSSSAWRNSTTYLHRARRRLFASKKCSNRSYRNRILRRGAFLREFLCVECAHEIILEKKVRAWRSLDWIILVSLGYRRTLEFLQNVFIATQGYEYLSRANILKADKWNVHPWSFNIWFSVIIIIKPFSTRCAVFSIIKC